MIVAEIEGTGCSHERVELSGKLLDGVEAEWVSLNDVFDILPEGMSHQMNIEYSN